MKKLCLLLVIAMLFAVCFSGCGVKGVPVSEEENAKQVTEETPLAEKEEPSDVPEEEKDSEEAAPKEAEQPSAPANETPSVDLNNVLNAIISGVGANDPLIVPASRLSSLYGIDASLVKQAASYVTIEGAFPDEIVLVEAVSEEAAETIQLLLGIRLSEVKEQSKSYDPENYALAQQCTVGKKGKFVSMFLAPEHAKMNAIFNSYVK